MQRKIGRAGKPGKKRVRRVSKQRVDSTSATSADASDIGATEQVEVVGIVEANHSMNTIEVNEAALNAEVQATLATAPATEPAPLTQEGDAPSAVVESWEPIIKQGVMPIVCVGILPQWQITDAEREELGTALTLCLDQAFPGAMDGKYACWVRLILASVGLVAVRYMQQGKLPPIGPKLIKQDDKDAASAETKTA